MDKKEYIRQLANFLANTETTMSAENLAIHLNWNGFETNDGQDYKGKRGTYTLIRTTHQWLKDQQLDDDAENVAWVFRKSDGTFAFE